MLNTLYHPPDFMAESRITVTKKGEKEKKRVSTDVFSLSAWIFAYLCTQAYAQYRDSPLARTARTHARTLAQNRVSFLIMSVISLWQAGADEQIDITRA